MRRTVQAMGFAWTGALFMLCAAFYSQLTQPRLIPLFRLLYYLSRRDSPRRAPASVPFGPPEMQ